jgi:hypothetical protein
MVVVVVVLVLAVVLAVVVVLLVLTQVQAVVVVVLLLAQVLAVVHLDVASGDQREDDDLGMVVMMMVMVAQAQAGRKKAAVFEDVEFRAEAVRLPSGHYCTPFVVVDDLLRGGTPAPL